MMSWFRHNQWVAVCALGIPLAWLWYRLLALLSVEWSANAQYAYGYAVPFLCLYLARKKSPRPAAPPESRSSCRAAALCRRSPATPDNVTPSLAAPVEPPATALKTTPPPESRSSCRAAALCRRSPATPDSAPTSFRLVLLSLIALAWLPVRLVAEANPDWRLVAWATTLDVVGLTWLLIIGVRNPTLPGRRVGFALGFFLVAVPWPTLLEQPVVQGLARCNAVATVEAVNLLGTPALRQGNIIEVGTGAVGIAEACSGIRSLQAMLMVSVFLGELYRLQLVQRVLCVAAGFLFSLVFNVARTVLLTWVAARQGLAAASRWHDGAGFTIFLASLLCVWTLVRWFRSRPPRPENGLALPGARPPNTQFPCSLVRENHWPAGALVLLSLWLMIAEVMTEGWYRWHEAGLAPPVTWGIELPRRNPTLRLVPLGEEALHTLRCDEAMRAVWDDAADLTCEAIFLRWQPGRVAAALATSHTPEVCLRAGGFSLQSQTGRKLLSLKGLDLPFRSFTATDPTGPVHVFYCLWEDRRDPREFAAERLTYRRRVAAVLRGRRNSGQRSLELALWGCADAREAEQAFRRILARCLVVR